MYEKGMVFNMKNNTEKILSDYYKTINEDQRLVKDKAHYIEFLTTIKYIEKYLKNDDRILEIGAATRKIFIVFCSKRIYSRFCGITRRKSEYIKIKSKD